MHKAAALCLVLGLAGDVDADTVYVADSLRLGLHAAADTGDRPFESLVSGTALEVLERNSNYARVRLADGREGWVEASYIVTERPAAVRELEAATRSAESTQQTIERLQRENAAHAERLDAHRHTLPIVWVVPALLVALGAGFLAGLWWLDASIRRRHGGFRVY